MRLRLIGVLAALMMLAPAAGFARTSVTAAQPIQEQAASASTKPKKAKKMKKAAKVKKATKKVKKNTKKEKKGTGNS